MSNCKKLLIAVTGMPGSGKSLVSRFFRERGFTVLSMGDIVRREAERRGLEKTPKNLLMIAEDIRKKYGPQGVALLMLEELEKSKWPVVIDGVRGMCELKVFSKIASCIHVIAVHASPRTRFQRLLARGRPGDPRSWEEFVERDKTELGFGLGEVIALADTMIVNEGSVDDLLRTLESRLEEILSCSAGSGLKYL